jgi:hypothetical protein
MLRVAIRKSVVYIAEILQQLPSVIRTPPNNSDLAPSDFHLFEPPRNASRNHCLVSNL